MSEFITRGELVAAYIVLALGIFYLAYHVSRIRERLSRLEKRLDEDRRKGEWGE